MSATSRQPLHVADALALARLLARGERVFLPGAAAEVPALVDALCESHAPPLAITSSFVPGINPAPLDRLPPCTSFTSVFCHPGAGPAQTAGRFRHLPMSYGAYAARLCGIDFDTCVVHVSPPDAAGNCS